MTTTPKGSADDGAMPEFQCPVCSTPSPEYAPGTYKCPECLYVWQPDAPNAPLCLLCGIKLRPAGIGYVCEQCGSTQGYD